MILDLRKNHATVIDIVVVYDDRFRCFDATQPFAKNRNKLRWNDVKSVMADRICSNPAELKPPRAAEDDNDASQPPPEFRVASVSVTVAPSDAEEDVFRFRQTPATTAGSADTDPGDSERPDLLGSRRRTPTRFEFPSPVQPTISAGGRGSRMLSGFDVNDRSGVPVRRRGIVISLVPNIIVEPVSPWDAHGHSLTPPFVSSSSSRWPLSASSGERAPSRQLRAHSDSTVHDAERRSMILRSPSHIPSSSSGGLFRQFDQLRHREAERPSGTKDVTSKHGGTPALRTPGTSQPIVDEREESGATGYTTHVKSYLETGAVVAQQSVDRPSVPFLWHFHSHRSQSAHKSPKTHWMRRHSDSNLAAGGHVYGGGGLRVEPYPTRSRSTGDSVPVDAVANPDEPRRSAKDVIVASSAADQPTVGERTTEERSKGLYEKRLKLKKYLQTRYQMSLLELRQSSDAADEVFTDRPPDPMSLAAPGTSALKSRMQTDDSDATSRADRTSELFSSERSLDDEKAKHREFGLGHHRGFESSVLREERGFSDVWERRFGRGGEGGGEETALPLVTRSSDVPIFLFPSTTTMATERECGLVASPRLAPPRTQDSSSSSLGLSSEAMEWSRTSDSTGSPTDERIEGSSPADRRQRYRLTTRRKQIQPPRSTTTHIVNFPLFVDVAGRSQGPWEGGSGGDRLTLARQQSVSSRASPISEPPVLPLPRFPSLPALSSGHHHPPVPPVSPGLRIGWQEPSSSNLSPFLFASAAALSSSSSTWSSFPKRFSYGPSSPHETRESVADLRLQLTCPLCSRDFMSYGHLAGHMASHTPTDAPVGRQEGGSGASGSKSHPCAVCKRSFSRSDMLTRHMRLHTGLRPYECHLCGQVFSRSDHLHTHLRTHTGEKPYKCTSCPYAAPRRDMVTRHMRVHARTTPRRGRRSASVSSAEAATAPLSDALHSEFASLSSEEVRRRIQSLSSIEPVGGGGSSRWTSSSSLTRDSSTSVASVDVFPDVVDAMSPSSLAFRVRHSRTSCSLTSNESTEGSSSDVLHVASSDAAGRAWSSASCRSFESFSTSPRLSWSSSADSPDIFCRVPQHFFCSARGSAPPTRTPEKPQQHDYPPSLPRVDLLSIDAPTSFERRSVATPDRDRREDIAADVDKTKTGDDSLSRVSKLEEEEEEEGEGRQEED